VFHKLDPFLPEQRRAGSLRAGAGGDLKATMERTFRPERWVGTKMESSPLTPLGGRPMRAFIGE
jgi:hypothetical protein